MSQNLVESSVDGVYEIAGGKINFTPDYVVKHTNLPKETPRIIGWSGPARSGTTALLFLFANCPEVDRVYFQPQKTLLRKGSPEFTINDEDKLICLKEVFGQHYPEECYDPIDMLIRAGAKPEKITWISILRDPLQTFASWNSTAPCDPEVFMRVQEHTLDLFKRYRSEGINMIPFAYELFKGQENKAVSALMGRLGLNTKPHVDFDMEVISNKMVWGQASDRAYFDYNIGPTIGRKKFIYSRNKYVLPLEFAQELSTHCMDRYLEFYNLAADELGLATQRNVKLVRGQLAYGR
jgi:hypothetical protein